MSLAFKTWGSASPRLRVKSAQTHSPAVPQESLASPRPPASVPLEGTPGGDPRGGEGCDAYNYPWSPAPVLKLCDLGQVANIFQLQFLHLGDGNRMRIYLSVLLVDYMR